MINLMKKHLKVDENILERLYNDKIIYDIIKIGRYE